MVPSNSSEGLGEALPPPKWEVPVYKDDERKVPRNDNTGMASE